MKMLFLALACLMLYSCNVFNATTYKVQMKYERNDFSGYQFENITASNDSDAYKCGLEKMWIAIWTDSKENRPQSFGVYKYQGKDSSLLVFNDSLEKFWSSQISEITFKIYKEVKRSEDSTRRSFINNSSETKNDFSQWIYTSDPDLMNGSNEYIASLTADQNLNLKFPYNGDNSAMLKVRKKAGTLDVILFISKGQLMAVNSSEGGKIKVKFDSENPEDYQVNRSDDNSSNYAFILESRKFLTKLKKSKKVIVEASIYDNGDQHIK